MRAAREIIITGSVQGVGFRWTAKRIADSFGLDGWVRNNSDGSVSLAIEGDEADLDAFMERLDQTMGAYIARIESRDSKPGKNRDGFVILR